MTKDEAKQVRPLSGMVLCRVLTDVPERPGSLIVLPDNAKGRPDRCEVIAVSRGVHTAKGALIEPPVNPGERCIFNAYRIDKVLDHGQLATAEGTPVAKAGEYFLIAQNQLLCVIEP